MNQLCIRNRTEGIIYRFWMPSTGGYVYLDTTGKKPGALGDQICKPGGSTIIATPETFEQTCRKWYRRYHSKIK